MKNVADPTSPAATAELASRDRFVLWMDGAGVCLCCLDDQVTLGGVRPDGSQADVCFQSNLARRHVTLLRNGERYRLLPQGPVTFNGKALDAAAHPVIELEESARWVLGEDVEIQFSKPHVLSHTAVLKFPGGHKPLIGQPAATVDQVVLIDQNCLIGPGETHHIKLEDCPEDILLFRHKGQLWCRCNSEFSVNDESPLTSSRLESGDVVTGKDFRFRLEAV